MEWKPDIIHRLLECGKGGGPKIPALAGYYLHKIIFALMIVHSGVVFAGVLTYEALDVAGCLPNSDDDDATCSVNGSNNDDDTVDCKRLWGLIKPDSLLTVIATGAAIILAISSIFMGTILDITPYRRQIGIIGTLICIFSITLCVAIIQPNETTLAICSVGLFILFIFKDLHFLVIESYVPELSHISSEISHAVSVASTWLYGGEILNIILWVIVGLFITGPLYGFVVTIGTVILMLILTPLSYSRLPNVPAVITLPKDETIFKHTLQYQMKLFTEIYHEFPDLGIVLAAHMVYDPALNALFIAAIQVLVSKYHFTSSEIPIILGVAIICATIGAYLCKYSSYFDTLCCVFPSHKQLSHLNNRQMVSDDNSLQVQLQPQLQQEQVREQVQQEELEQIGEIDLEEEKNNQEKESYHSNQEIHGAIASCNVIPFEQQSSLTFPSSSTRYLVAKRLKRNIMYGLLAVIIITLCGTYFMKPCDLGLACGFGALWGITLAYCWTSSNLIRATLVPGGKEGQFAGLLVSAGNILSWLPLLIFSIANEVWTINGAMITLTGFYLLGIIIISFCSTDNGVKAALDTLSNRRWAKDNQTNSATVGNEIRVR